MLQIEFKSQTNETIINRDNEVTKQNTKQAVKLTGEVGQTVRKSPKVTKHGETRHNMNQRYRWDMVYLAFVCFFLAYVRILDGTFNSTMSVFQLQSMTYDI